MEPKSESSTDAAALDAAALQAAELVRRIRAGEAAAEREMVERYSRGVRFLLLELTRDPSRADDLHQETFRLVLEKVRAGELREPGKLAAFIRQIARNLFLGEYRQSAKRLTVDGDQALAGSLDPTPDPQKRLLDRENAAIVRRLLAELEPARDREILLRLFVAEHSKDEICADLGLSSLHFNRVLHRARQRLKHLLVRHDKRQNLSAALSLLILVFALRGGDGGATSGTSESASCKPGRRNFLNSPEIGGAALHSRSEDPPTLDAWSSQGDGSWIM